MMKEGMFTIVTVSKSRLNHLMRSLPRMHDQGCPVVLVDYACPEASGAWAHQNIPGVQVLRVEESVFSVAKARNLGAAIAKTEALLFVDADVLIPGNFLSILSPEYRPDRFIRFLGQGPSAQQGTWGLCVVPREAFVTVGGYDECFRGWGGEDDDLYYRLKNMGLKEAVFSASILETIPHPDHLRTAHYEQKDKVISFAESRMYRELKYFVMRFFGVRSELQQQTRLELSRLAREATRAWQAGGCKTHAPVKIDLTQIQNLCDTHKLRLKGSLEVSFDPIQE